MEGITAWFWKVRSEAPSHCAQDMHLDYIEAVANESNVCHNSDTSAEMIQARSLHTKEVLESSLARTRFEGAPAARSYVSQSETKQSRQKK
jgi:hypothetical protein